MRISPQDKPASRRLLMLALLVVLVLSPVGTSVLPLEHQHHPLDEDCSLCLIGAQLETGAVPANPIYRPTSPAAAIAPKRALLNRTVSVRCYPARAPPSCA